jgi:hypothetical protein
MPRSRFVQPQTSILTLGNGDTLVVRRRLNVGEQRESYAVCSTVVEQPDGSVKLVPNPLMIGIAKVAAYLVDWNLAGDDEPIRGLAFADRIALLNNFDPAEFDELKTAVDAHESAMNEARLAEKKILTGSTNADPTLDLRSVAAGASSGSAS